VGLRCEDMGFVAFWPSGEEVAGPSLVLIAFETPNLRSFQAAQQQLYRIPRHALRLYARCVPMRTLRPCAFIVLLGPARDRARSRVCVLSPIAYTSTSPHCDGDLHIPKHVYTTWQCHKQTLCSTILYFIPPIS
jgi:hypothetical protein